jgi:TolA-binding protein
MRVEILYAFPRWQAAALLQAAKCRELLGEWSEAVRLYSRLLEKYPDTPYTEDAKSRLQAARDHLAGVKNPK